MTVGGYRDALRFCPGRSVEFDTETFIASRPSAMRPFLLTLLNLQAFEQFIGDRLAMLNSGRGFRGLFESEANSCVDRMDSQRRYKEWIKVVFLHSFRVLCSLFLCHYILLW